MNYKRLLKTMSLLTATFLSVAFIPMMREVQAGEVVDRLSYVSEEAGHNSQLEDAIIKGIGMDSQKDRAATRYQYNYVDLNGDGKKEIFTLLVGPYTSGTGGDTALIFQQGKNGLQLKQKFTLVSEPVIISKSKTKGWNDIIVQQSGGGAKTRRVQLKYNGKKYPNISNGVTLSNKVTLKGTVILSETSDVSKELYLPTEAERKLRNDMVVKTKEIVKTYNNKKGKQAMRLTYTYPVLSGDYKGISKINQQLVKEKDQWILSHKNIIKEAREYSLDESSRGCYDDQVVYAITYNKNNLISVVQSGYLYMGGAHGTPYRISTIFDINTGKKLGIMDVMKGNSTQVKNLIVKTFQKEIKKVSNGYDEGALETVKKTKINDFSFYLTEEGVCFYFEPYALACYAAGFKEAVISYDQTKLSNLAK